MRMLKKVPWKSLGKQTGRFLLKRLYLLLIPLLTVLVLEALNRPDFSAVWGWIIERPDEFALNCWIAFFLTLIAAGAAGSSRLACSFMLVIAIAAGAASGISMNRTGLPLLPWRLLLPGKLPDPVAGLNPYMTTHLLLAMGSSIILTAGILVIRSVKLNWRERCLYLASGLLLLGVLLFERPLNFWTEFGITTFRYEQEASYRRNGFLANTMDNLRFLCPIRPSGSGAKDIRSLVRSLPEGQGGIAPAEETFFSGSANPQGVDEGSGATRARPNVIVLLSESFWDPTLLPLAAFSEDPIPYFRSLMDSTTSGWMLTPQFSGTTANVEFEVLTGNSVRFLPKDAIGYVNYMNRGVDSLAGILARQGYSTTAINPYFNWFFNSRNVYRNMGFSRFISCEFFAPRFHGPNYEDSQVMEKIIESTGSTPGPHFVFANTMENHGSYEDKFYSRPISVTGPFSAKTKNILENYAAGAQAFDKAFQTLVEHYKSSREPTVIMAFGDHLPGLGYDYLAYKEGGYITGRKDPALMDKLYYTPFIIWDNMELQPKEELRMNASFLGPYLLRYAGLSGSYYTDYLYSLYQKHPLIPVRPFLDSQPFDEKLLSEYKRLQYDILFGRQEGYRLAGIGSAIVPEYYELGYGNPKLDSVFVDSTGDLRVEGGRFSTSHEVLVNGQPLYTSFSGSGYLYVRSADLPKDHKDWTIQVRLVDRKNTVISQSDTAILRAMDRPAAALTSP